MKVTEIFYSLQGEGRLVGVPSVFVRLSGCPLRCKWCDTKYAWDIEAGQDLSVDEILMQVQKWYCKFVVITGGEPMVNTDLTQRTELPVLMEKLKEADKHITIETAGISFVPDLPCDLMSISPKLSNSVPDESSLAAVHRDSRLDIAVLRQFIRSYKYQLKFVIDSGDDFPEIQETIQKMGNVDPQKVLLMPQAKTKDELLAKSPMVAQICKDAGCTFGQRLQLLLWDNQRAM